MEKSIVIMVVSFMVFCLVILYLVKKSQTDAIQIVSDTTLKMQAADIAAKERAAQLV